MNNMIINELRCAVGEPTKEMPRPYEDAIKNIVEDLELYLPTLNGKVIMITVTVEIE